MRPNNVQVLIFKVQRRTIFQNEMNGTIWVIVIFQIATNYRGRMKYCGNIAIVCYSRSFKNGVVFNHTDFCYSQVFFLIKIDNRFVATLN